MRRFEEKKLVLATHNKGKRAEFQKLLAPYEVEVISAAELDLPEPEETGQTFKQNALLKARAAAQASGFAALADDSGLCVHALNHNPGIYSARWCGASKDPMIGMQRIHDELGDSEDRAGYFVAVLALVWPDGHAETFEGRCYGFMVWPPRGDQGHGYDPMFVPEDGNGRSFAEMAPHEKDAISHRGRAVQDMLAVFKAS